MKRQTKAIPMKKKKSLTLTTFRLIPVTLHPPPEAVGNRVSGPQESHLHPVQRRVLQRQSWA
jgi:hypothetical protein